jgi:hypothetical protein
MALFRGGQTANGNTILGNLAGSNILNGQGNVMLGNEAGYNFNGNNPLIIDNSGQFSNALIYGDFASDKVAINWDYNTMPTSTFTVDGTSEFLDEVYINGTTTIDGQTNCQ